MKLNILLVLAVIACAFAEDDKKEENPWSNLVEEWKAIYGKYGVEAYYPVQYRVALRYPVVNPSYTLSYPYVQPSYRISYPLRVKASYDPEYFNEVYGYYPAL